MDRLLTKFALAVILAVSIGSVALPAAAHPSTDITASNWKFTPNTITLHVGETTQLRLTSTEGVHGIESSDLSIPLTTIQPGKFVVVNVTPKKAGIYVLHCAIMCGPGHEKMALTIVVTDSK
ncbi:MAG: cupredoxin domain-containing protein [Candidatus Baltobacteraceae bacterium]